MKSPQRRIARLNSLLREVITEVIKREAKDPKISPLTSITRVEITPDLKHAKVFVSVIGSEAERQQTMKTLETSAGFISSHSSKKVRMRYFPSLSFYLDHSVEDQMKIEKILQEIDEKRKKNPPKDL